MRSATKSVAIVTVVLAVSSIGMSIMGFVVLALLPAGFLPMSMTSGSAYVPMILGGLAGMFVGASGVTFGLRLRLSLYLCAMALVLNVANAVVGSTMVPYTPAMYFGVVIIHLPLVVGLLPKVRPWLRPVGGRARQVRRAGSPSQAWS